jgi:hypothetical protein
VALKSAQPEGDKVDIEELLEYIDKTLDRTKVLYEQYFLGMQKQPPAQLHTDVERRLRELQQLNIRNTGLRYRFATLQQKFGSYNSYWRRTLRQIENGTYIRNLAKISRNAAMTGEEVPEEILAAMPKRMREQVKRDREQALAAKRRRAEEAGADVDVDMGDLDDAAVINSSPPKITRPPPMQKGTHALGADDGDFDIEAFFASVTDEKSSTKPTMAIFEEPRDEDTEPNAQVPTRASVRTMPIARVAAAGALPPKAVPRAVEDDPTGVHEQRAPRPVEDEPTGVVSPVVRALPGLPIKQSPIPGVTNLAPPRGTATPVPGVPITRPGTATPVSTPVPSSATQARPPTSPGQARPPTSPGQPTNPEQTRPTGQGPGPQQARPPTGPGQARPPTGLEQRPPTSPGQARPPTGPGHAPSSGSQTPKTQAVPVVPPPRPGTPPPIPRPGVPLVPKPIPAPPARTQAMPVVPMPPRPVGAGNAPSQQSRPNPIAPGATSGRQPIPVQSMQGPFEPTPVAPKPKPVVPAPKPDQPAQRPPPGMNEADVNALYAKYVKAKEMVGEDAGPGAYGKLMKTINAQAPKIMEQYKAKGVEFSVVVKDNQVIIKAKPKT